MLAVGNDRQFRAFCTAAGRATLMKDKRFRTNAGRVKHRVALIPMIDKLCRKKPTKTWLRLLAKAGVPCGPINDLAQVFEEPQVLHRKLRFDLVHGAGGQIPQVRNPVFYSRTALEYPLPPPVLGEHTSEVLAAELGLSAGEIMSLKADAVIC
jgi:crotonobetainyl-CoA:carnitine CoA-transferase CaiB-like acyl-CoA transferase